MPTDAELVSIQFRTLFRVTEDGRIERENDPDRSPGPRLWLAGCEAGNVIGLRSDVSDGLAAEIAAVAATEPSFVDRGGPPRHVERYVELLSRAAAVSRRSLGLSYRLPHRLRHESRVRVIDGDSREGQRLQARFSAEGMPGGLAELGFRSVADLWTPWCVAMVEGEVASIAFAARLGEAGAELGLATVKAFRGQGYAAAAAAGWTAMPALQSRALYYSTDQANVSSQRVVARLGLGFLGASLRLS